jgi:hypothetical protein
VAVAVAVCCKVQVTCLLDARGGEGWREDGGLLWVRQVQRVDARLG